MLDLIELLERMGQDSDLRYVPGSEVMEALARAGLQAPLPEAIWADDRRELESLLGANANLFCGIARPDEEEREDESEEDEEDEDGEDDHKTE